MPLRTPGPSWDRIEHQVARVVPERAGRISGGVVLDAAAGRILRRGGEMRRLQRRGVCPDGVPIRAVQNERAAREHGVEVGAREGEPRGIDLHDLEPRLAWGLIETGCHLRLDRCRPEHLIAQIALALILRTLGRMSVGVDDARQDHTAMQIDHASSGTDEAGDRLVAADRDDGVSAQRDRLRDAALYVLGVNAAVEQDEVGGRLGRGTCGGRQRAAGRRRGQHPHQPPKDNDPSKIVDRRLNRR